ncbi:hypothetical protein EMIT0P228_10819 [Pseudomonas brassicacearum]
MIKKKKPKTYLGSQLTKVATDISLCRIQSICYEARAVVSKAFKYMALSHIVQRIRAYSPGRWEKLSI